MAHLELIECDYFKYIYNRLEGHGLYHGEYMAQYSWAEETKCSYRNRKIFKIDEKLKKTAVKSATVFLIFKIIYFSYLFLCDNF